MDEWGWGEKWHGGDLSCGLAPEEGVDLLFDPRLVVGGVSVGGSLVDQAAEVGQLVDEVEQLRDVVSDGGDVGVHPLQMLLVDLANSLEALVDWLVIRVGPGLRPGLRLDQKDRVAHYEFPDSETLPRRT